VICKTTIGKGSPNRAGTAKAHGEPLGADEIKLVREGAGLDGHEPFVMPEEAYAAWDAKAAGAAAEAAWAEASPPTRPRTPSWPPSSCAA
jgi:transketolase